LAAIRILLTDDYAGWRSQIPMLLRARPDWQVIAEAADGLEAVQKAQELRPDIILLDIALPKLNGIEAARRIRQVSPQSKIIFLSQNNDADIVREALSTGAYGYVRKTDVKKELLTAMNAVLSDRQFVSSSLRDEGFIDPSVETALHRHEVQFYSDDDFLLDTFADFIARALKSGCAAIAILTESHQEGLVLRLKAQGIDVDGYSQKGTYIRRGVGDALSTFMVNDMPDSTRFFSVVGGLIKEAAKAASRQHRGVVACGECSPLLWAEGNADAAIRVEQLWDEISKAFGMDTLCGYASSSFHGEEHKHVYQNICAEHSAVFSQ
jgi:DNA-binding NarL/FixJ family response regulator